MKKAIQDKSQSAGKPRSKPRKQSAVNEILKFDDRITLAKSSSELDRISDEFEDFCRASDFTGCKRQRDFLIEHIRQFIARRRQEIQRESEKS